MTRLLQLYDTEMTNYGSELAKVLRLSEQGQYCSEMKQVLKKIWELLNPISKLMQTTFSLETIKSRIFFTHAIR